MPTDVLRINQAAGDLSRLARAFDAACHELRIGLAGLDVRKRELLVKRAMKLAHANDPQPENDA